MATRQKDISGLSVAQYEKRKKLLKQYIGNKTVINKTRNNDGVIIEYMDGQKFYCSGRLLNDIALCF